MGKLSKVFDLFPIHRKTRESVFMTAKKAWKHIL